MDMREALKRCLAKLEELSEERWLGTEADSAMLAAKDALSHIGDGSKAEPVEVWLGNGDKLVSDIFDREEGEWVGVGVFNGVRQMEVGEFSVETFGKDISELDPVALIKTANPDSLRVIIAACERSLKRCDPDTHPAPTAQDSNAKDNAVQQAKIWAQEARTQRSIVEEIGKLVGCTNDWEMVSAVKAALAAQDSKVPEELKAVAELAVSAMETSHGKQNLALREVHSRLTRLLSAAPVPDKPQWGDCAERMPTAIDADVNKEVWFWDSHVGAPILRKWFEYEEHYTYWMPTGLQRPAAPEGE